MIACGTDHLLETTCSHDSKLVHKQDFGQVAFTVEARSGSPIHLTKFMVYHTSRRASAEELCGRLEFTIDHAMAQGFQHLLTEQERYMDDFWRRSDVRAPEDDAILRFPLTYRGQVLEVEVTRERVEYTLRDGDGLTIHHETEELRLTRERPSAIRPVSRHH